MPDADTNANVDRNDKIRNKISDAVKSHQYDVISEMLENTKYNYEEYEYTILPEIIAYGFGYNDLEPDLECLKRFLDHSRSDRTVDGFAELLSHAHNGIVFDFIYEYAKSANCADLVAILYECGVKDNTYGFEKMLNDPNIGDIDTEDLIRTAVAEGGYDCVRALIYNPRCKLYKTIMRDIGGCQDFDVDTVIFLLDKKEVDPEPLLKEIAWKEWGYRPLKKILSDGNVDVSADNNRLLFELYKNHSETGSKTATRMIDLLFESKRVITLYFGKKDDVDTLSKEAHMHYRLHMNDAKDYRHEVYQCLELLPKDIIDTHILKLLSEFAYA